MKLAQLGALGAEIPVVMNDDGTAFDLRPVTGAIDGSFFERGGVGEARDAVVSGRLPLLRDVSAERIGSPIARPSALIGVGMNYAAHAAESGAAPPTVPVMFLKTPNSIAGPNDDVPLPYGSKKLDWEVELGVVIGKQSYRLPSLGHARRAIAGFVLVDDISERAHQIEESGGQWSKGKSAPGFAPVGPWLVTPDEFDSDTAGLRSWVNGEPRQDSNSADMIFSVDYLVWHLSQYLRFEPGDLLITGTPQGVALSGRFDYLRDQDIVEVEIDGLGRQRHRISG